MKKFCPACKKSLDASRFGFRSNGRTLAGLCRACMVVRTTAWRKAHMEKSREYCKKWAKANRDKVRGYEKRRYYKNRDRILARRREKRREKARGAGT